MRTIALVDYGSGNLSSAEKALRLAASGADVTTSIAVTDDPDLIARADGVVLPGVGAFAACMAALLDRSGVVEAMTLAVQERGAPFLGICVGMQLLAREGREFGVTPGLAWIDGEVHRLSPTGRGLKVPHMGWNSLDGDFQGPLWGGLPAGVHMYFTHSYVLSPDERADAAAWTEHGGEFVSAVVKGNVAGVQFHPEKSQGAGARLLGNFLNWRP